MSASAPVVRLASASPRRRQLLTQIGVPHVAVGADIDETPWHAEPARDYVLRMARTKALAVWRADPSLPVLAADTTVVLDGLMYGKPRDREQALQMLTALSDRTHEVLTAVALAYTRGVVMRLNVSSVRLRALKPEECAGYWDTGEPLDKAGGYAIQGLAAAFIETLSGSYSGVMGLPLYDTSELLQTAGIACWPGVPP